MGRPSPTAIRIAAILIFPWCRCGSFAIAQATIAQSTTAPADLPSATPDSLYSEMLKAVELAQRSIRTAKPPAATRPAKNTFQKDSTAATIKPDDPVKHLADDLVGKTGTISFRVKDVLDGHKTLPIFSPIDIYHQIGKADYLINAECDNPTATYMSPTYRAHVQQEHDRGVYIVVKHAKDWAESTKPKHELWILSDNPTVTDWAKGSKHMIHAEVIEAALTTGLNRDYVKASLLLKMEKPATTAPANGDQN